MIGSKKKRILLAVDGSERLLTTVRHVGRMISTLPIEVLLFHVFSPIPESFWDLGQEPQYHNEVCRIRAWEAHERKKAAEFMESALKVLHEAGLPEDAVSFQIQDRVKGIARDIIAKSREGFDTVVVGSTGAGKLMGFVFGTTANKLLGKLTDVSLLVVNGGGGGSVFGMCVLGHSEETVKYYRRFSLRCE